MEDFHFSRKSTVSRQSGPVYVNSPALRGIKAKYAVPIPIPDPVTLPTTWIPPVLPSEDTLRINFVLEQEVLKQAEIRRLAMVGEAASPCTSIKGLTESLNSNVPLIPYQHTTILTPVPVASTTAMSKNSSGGGSSVMGTVGSQPTTTSDVVAGTLGELSLRDFEGDANDPFEMTTLQAIDDMAELRSVLQPELAQTSTVSAVSNSVSHSSQPPLPPPKPVSYHPAPSCSNPDPASMHGASFPLPVPSHLNHSSTIAGACPVLGTSPGSHDHSVGTLINIDSNEPSPPLPLAQPTPLPRFPGASRPLPPVAPKPRSSLSKPAPGPSHTARVPGVLPPLTGPVPVHHRPLGGVSVLPPISGAVPVLPPPPGHSPPTINPQSQLPQSVSSQPEPLPLPPPYSVHVPASHISVNPSPSTSPLAVGLPRQYQLPDVQASLPNEQKASLAGICRMGFPAPRVARALKEFDGDDAKAIEFLVLVGELEEKGHSGDSAETALLVHKQDVKKSLDYLKQVAQYSEVWCEGDIHDAYQRSDGDWDKSIDILTQGR